MPKPQRGNLRDRASLQPNVGEGERERERERSVENIQLASASHNGISYEKVHYSEADIDQRETCLLWRLLFKRERGSCV